MWTDLDQGDAAAHSGADEGIEVEREPRQRRLGQASQKGAQSQQGFLADQVEVVVAEIEVAPGFGGAVVCLLGLLAGAAEFLAHNFGGSAQQTQLKLIEAAGTENELVQKTAHTHIIHHGFGPETVGMDAAGRHQHLGILDMPGQRVEEVGTDTRDAVPLGGGKADQAPGQIGVVGGALLERVVEGDAQHHYPRLDFRRKTVVDGQALALQPGQACKRLWRTGVHTQYAPPAGFLCASMVCPV